MNMRSEPFDKTLQTRRLNALSNLDAYSFYMNAVCHNVIKDEITHHKY